MPVKEIEKITKRFKPRLVKQNKFIATSGLTTTPKRRPKLSIIVTKAALPIAVLFTLPAVAKSLLNPMTRSYSVIVADQFGSLNLKRTYSSGSIFRGHFGPGWCSEVDGKIAVFDAGELRYRGCNVENADLIDARATAKSIRRTFNGFERSREDGATQVFNAAGFLEKVIRNDGIITVLRDSAMYPTELLIHTAKIESQFKIELEARHPDPSFALIKMIGRNAKYGFRDGLLISSEADSKTISRYAYDTHFNMTGRSASRESETVEYDDVEDRVVRIERTSVFGRERLLFAELRDEKSRSEGPAGSKLSRSKIEIRMEVERGAETHPVRILYDVVTHRISLEGERSIARLLLNWIRA
jgi:hypothetical protein